MIKICEWCGSEFSVEEHGRNSNRQRFCTYECRYKAGNERVRSGAIYHNMVCMTCGKVYLSRRLDSVSCSVECKQKRNQQLAKERYRRLFHGENKPSDYGKKEEKRRIPPMHEIEAEARKHGMNYGQYYALMLQKQEIEERERRKANGI